MEEYKIANRTQKKKEPGGYCSLRVMNQVAKGMKLQTQSSAVSDVLQ
jgi:hypothetical protein